MRARLPLACGVAATFVFFARGEGDARADGVTINPGLLLTAVGGRSEPRGAREVVTAVARALAAHGRLAPRDAQLAYASARADAVARATKLV